ncbi:YaaR family protein [Virgibacillus sp. NKC19-16]|uniref:YaaR family protein n=1 Tax=Virgibacillus salidurans TaxID=2831673 RepID=UPI001F278DA0|nr:YaaR family protein [Virgibacillus sp. NKC19-16]UJL46459.1 YaaR family protein [Virgibacillus sp. NKC19-16]
MKISQEMQTQTKKEYTRPQSADTQAFHKQLQSQTKHLKQQELQQLMKNITMQGDKVARFRSFRDITKFKRMVKDFLKETVYNGLDLQKSYGFNMEGQNRKLAVVKEVDAKLLELTEEMMNQEKKTVDILGLIGEIKGLLINIYT